MFRRKTPDEESPWESLVVSTASSDGRYLTGYAQRGRYRVPALTHLLCERSDVQRSRKLWRGGTQIL